MRYRDARHIDLKSFHARRPALGAVFRFVAYGVIAVVPVLMQRDAVTAMRILLGASILWWILAWFSGVGSAWRTGCVAAALLLATALTLHRCGVLA